MTRRLAARLGRLAVATLAAVGVPLGAPTPARADPLSACTPSTGTVVAVDFGPWSGPIVRGCGVSAATGYDLLHDAGFSTAGDQHDGAGFICRIGSGSFHGGAQYPTAAQDPCVVTPPATAYWSFWRAGPGDTHWTYNQIGATGYHPQPGEVELWRYGSTSIDGSSGAPPYSPAGLRAAATRPSRPASAPTASTNPTRTTSPTAPAPATSGSTRSSTGSNVATNVASSNRNTAHLQGSVVAATAAPPPGGGGSATPAVLGGAGVAILAAAAGALAWRRRAAGRSG